MLESLLRVLGIIFPVFACSAVGTFYGWRFRPNMSTINQLNMQVFAPLLIFWAIMDKPFEFSGYWGLALGGTAVILGSGLILWPIAALLKINLKNLLAAHDV